MHMHSPGCGWLTRAIADQLPRREPHQAEVVSQMKVSQSTFSYKFSILEASVDEPARPWGFREGYMACKNPHFFSSVFTQQPVAQLHFRSLDISISRTACNPGFDYPPCKPAPPYLADSFAPPFSFCACPCRQSPPCPTTSTRPTRSTTTLPPRPLPPLHAKPSWTRRISSPDPGHGVSIP